MFFWDITDKKQIPINDFLKPYIQRLNQEVKYSAIREYTFHFSDKTKVDKIDYTYLLKSQMAKDIHSFESYSQSMELLVALFEEDFLDFFEKNKKRFNNIYDYTLDVFEEELNRDGLPKNIIGIRINAVNSEYGEFKRWYKTFSYSEWKQILDEVAMEGYDSEYYFAKAKHKKVKPYLSNKYDNSFAKRQRSLVTPKLRYEILRRDGFRCVCCGRSAKEGARLEVDHIKPVSKGGKTTKENLQTLCWECNRGKSDS